jgi:hypothetical protein
MKETVMRMAVFFMRFGGHSRLPSVYIQFTLRLTWYLIMALSDGSATVRRGNAGHQTYAAVLRAFAVIRMMNTAQNNERGAKEDGNMCTIICLIMWLLGLNKDGGPKTVKLVQAPGTL